MARRDSEGRGSKGQKTSRTRCLCLDKAVMVQLEKQVTALTCREPRSTSLWQRSIPSRPAGHYLILSSLNAVQAEASQTIVSHASGKSCTLEPALMSDSSMRGHKNRSNVGATGKRQEGLGINGL